MALVDLEAEPDPRAWLTERLGTLTACDAPEPSSEARRTPRPPVPATSAPAKPAPWDITASAVPPILHPPLPGEDLQQHRPPPAQAGLLGVVTGQRAVQTDPYPEPGSFEPAEEDLLPVPLGTPLPAQAPRAWWFELQRRKAAVPLPDMSIGWPANHFREERWQAAVAEVEAAWDIEWQAAWVAGSRLPPAEEGTTT